MAATSNRKFRGLLHLGRYGEIISVLVKYGFGDFVSNLNLERYISLTRRLAPKYLQAKVAKRVSRWERIRFALEELGPTFIKFGQFLSSRQDLLPLELISELERLQDDVKPMPFKIAIDIVEKNLKGSTSDLFQEFFTEPFASASISQVHKAVLKSGELVAVKVQRPRIKDVINTDIDILSHLIGVVQKRYDYIRHLHLNQLLQEFRRTTEKEMDFTIEASHLERFRRDFAKQPEYYFPRVYHQMTTKRILVTEFIHGIKVSDINAIDSANIDRKMIAHKGAKCILSQIFDHGFFHADPHPGNILIKKDGTICFIDFGAVGILPPSIRRHLGAILFGVVNKDPQRIVRALGQLTTEQIQNLEQLEYDIMEFIEEYSLLLLKEVNIGGILQRFASIIIAHELQVIPGFYTLLRSLVTTESIGRKLDPDFNLMEHLSPFVKKLMRQFPNMTSFPYDVYLTTIDFFALARDLPFEIKEILRTIKTGALNIQFEHRGLENLISKHDQMVNRLVLAIILGALIIGSSVVVHSRIPPQIFDIPLIGFLGFILAGIIGFGLIFTIIRSKKF